MYTKRLLWQKTLLKGTILLLIKNTFPSDGQEHATAEGGATINDYHYEFKVTSGARGDNNR